MATSAVRLSRSRRRSRACGGCGRARPSRRRRAAPGTPRRPNAHAEGLEEHRNLRVGRHEGRLVVAPPPPGVEEALPDLLARILGAAQLELDVVKPRDQVRVQEGLVEPPDVRVLLQERRLPRARVGGGAAGEHQGDCAAAPRFDERAQLVGGGRVEGKEPHRTRTPPPSGGPRLASRFVITLGYAQPVAKRYATAWKNAFAWAAAAEFAVVVGSLFLLVRYEHVAPAAVLQHGLVCFPGEVVAPGLRHDGERARAPARVGRINCLSSPAPRRLRVVARAAP